MVCLTSFLESAQVSRCFPGSPWGAGTYAGADGSRQPTELEREIAIAQGLLFWKTISKVDFGSG